MKTITIFIILILLFIPIVLSNVVILKEMDYGKTNWCGYAFASGKIIINTGDYCAGLFTYEFLLKHEMKHIFFWELPRETRMTYCDYVDLPYGELCWEEFAYE